MLGWMLNQLKREPVGGGSGGGKKPRIRFGKTGPRGRIYATTKGTVSIAKSKFIRAGNGSRPAIGAHLRYIQERERGEHEPERKFFDRDRQDIERGEVFENMMANRGERTAMHTLILSPGDNNVDIREYTRESMNALEERMGHGLDWYATIHENTAHWHAHVVIAGKIPGRERELERQEARGWEEGYNRMLAKEFSWKNQEQEIRELLGDRYDERAAKDPREERRDEWSRWGSGDEREPADAKIQDLLFGDNARSPAELKTERMLDRLDRQLAMQEQAKDRGEVYLDVNDLRELRAAGNDYVHRERSLERILDRAVDREFEREGPERSRDLELDRSRGFDAEQSSWAQVSQTFELDRVHSETERTYEESMGRESGRDDEERGREHDRGFDFGR
jgi:hypothetical protein